MLNIRHRSHQKSVVAARHQGGVALLEALIAIVIFSLGILGLIGLQANATKSTTQAKFRVDAAQVATQRIAATWLDQSHLAGYNETDTDISDILPDGTRTTVVAGNVVTVTVSWVAPGDTATNSYQATGMVSKN
ncbi:MAG: hypothetical protein KJ634_05615 [Gammaproteobacteria bacterium]|nr:hypothetical protein [Gammaproteobacteria bacterium]MBU1415082.1 hypothetical protein [Gammaproteobacteria bacterium]